MQQKRCDEGGVGNEFVDCDDEADMSTDAMMKRAQPMLSAHHDSEAMHAADSPPAATTDGKAGTSRDLVPPCGLSLEELARQKQEEFDRIAAKNKQRAASCADQQPLFRQANVADAVGHVAC